MFARGEVETTQTRGGEREGSVREKRDEPERNEISTRHVEERGLVSDFLRTAVPRRQKKDESSVRPQAQVEFGEERGTKQN